MIFLRFRTLPLVLPLCLLLSLRAQDSWTSVPSPTTADLWGVCYGGGQFVAVGSSGRIVTSRDGTTWTAQASGVSVWLTSVTFTGTRYLAVGDQGTILSSTDGMSWTVRATGPARLNGVAYSSAGYLAVGEAGTLATSPDGVTWTVSPIAFATIWLRGVIALDDTGTFRVTGAAGTRFDVRLVGGTPQLVATQNYETTLDIEAIARDPDDPALIAVAGSQGYVAGTEQRIGTYTTDRLRGIACYNHGRLIAVGESGLIVSGPYPFSDGSQSFTSATRPTSANLNAIALSPAAAVIAGGGGTILRMTLTPQTPAILAVSSPSPAYLGQTLTLSAKFSGTAPLACQWSRNGVPIAGATSDTLALPHVGAGEAGSYTLAVSNPYGTASAGPISVSPAYVPPSTVVDPGFHTSVTPWEFLGETSDQHLLLYGSRDDTAVRPSLLRLNADGSLDSSFQPAITAASDFIVLLSGTKTLFYGSTTASASQHVLVRLNADGSLDSTFACDGDYGYPVLLPDGRIACFAMPGRDQVTVTRLHADGTRDTTLAPYTIPLLSPFNAPSYEARPRTTQDAQGRTYVVFAQLLSHFTNAQSCLCRISADGTFDSSFATKTSTNGIDRIWWIDGKLCYDTGKNLVGAVTGFVRTFGRLTGSGDPDASFPLFRFTGSPPAGTFDRAGGLILTSPLPATNELIRYDSTGERDHAFSARLDASPYEIHELANGQLLMDGVFNSLNGVATHDLAKITPITDAYATRLTNLSLRTTAGSDADTLIAGFVVARSSGKRSVLIRGVGPGLIPHGIPATEALADPQLTLYRGSVASAANDDWNTDLIPTANAVGAFALATGSKDAALLASLAPASYAAHVSSRDGTSGIALAEIYDTDPAPASAAVARLANVSGRSILRTADDSLIAGFVIAGKATQRVLIRAVGPTLADYDVPSVLPNPRLTLYRERDAIAANDDWDVNSQIFAAVGAFPLRPASTDAALVVDLPPGTYSAVANGVGGATGAVLVEVYEVP